MYSLLDLESLIKVLKEHECLQHGKDAIEICISCEWVKYRACDYHPCFCENDC